MATTAVKTRIIVTRPDGQADELISAIELLARQSPLAAEIAHQPLINIVPVADDPQSAQLRQRMMNIDHYQAVIAISKNAAEIGLQWLDKYWPQPPVYVDWYGVGPTTADVLKTELEPVLMPAERFDSEGVLALDKLQQIEGQKILIWRGVGGRETLANVLRQRGAQVDYAELYERREVTYQGEDWDQLLDSHNLSEQPLLLLSSGQALDIVEQQVPDLAHKVGAILVPSERVAEKASDKGYKQVLVAASARDQDVLNQLRNWFSR